MATPAAAAKTPSQPTITATMSQWAANLTFDQLSPDAVYQAKRFLLDSIGCALGGYQQHDVIIALDVLDEIAGPGKATLIGSGKRMDAVSASLANALMIRCMDYNDIRLTFFLPRSPPASALEVTGASSWLAWCWVMNSRCGSAKLLSLAFASAAGIMPR